MICPVFYHLQANVEEQLMNHILDNYPQTARWVRPVENVTDVITMEMGLSIVRIAGFTPQGDAHSGYGTLAINGWLDQVGG